MFINSDEKNSAQCNLYTDNVMGGKSTLKIYTDDVMGGKSTLEENSTSYNMDAVELSNMIIISGKNQHPLTRRPLNEIEILRLRHRISLEQRVLLDFTLEYEHHIHIMLQNNNSLLEWLQSVAGRHLDRALCISELVEHDYDDAREDILFHLRKYEDVIDDIVSRCPGAIQGTLSHHKQIIINRMDMCDSILYNKIYKTIISVSDLYAWDYEVEVKEPAFALWLRS